MHTTHRHLRAGVIALALTVAALPAMGAQSTPGPHGAVKHTGPRGGSAVVGPNEQRAGAHGANGRNAAAGPRGGAYNGKSAAGFTGRRGAGAYNKNTGQYKYNGTNVECSGTVNAQGECVKK